LAVTFPVAGIVRHLLGLPARAVGKVENLDFSPFHSSLYGEILDGCEIETPDRIGHMRMRLLLR
jgi:hypothetical protein